MEKLAVDIGMIKQTMSIAQLSLGSKVGPGMRQKPKAKREGEKVEEGTRKRREDEREEEKNGTTQQTASNKDTQGVDSHREETSGSL